MLSKRISTALAIAAGVVIAVPAQAHPRLVGVSRSILSELPHGLWNCAVTCHWSAATAARGILRKGAAGHAPTKLPGTRVKLEVESKTLTVMPGGPLAVYVARCCSRYASVWWELSLLGEVYR
jgi:hypothetical protein